MDIAAMKLAAEAATPGPWDFDTAMQPYRIAGGEVVGGDALPYGDVYTLEKWVTLDGEESLIVAEEIGAANGRYIVAANPAAVLELIASHERLVAALQDLLSSVLAPMPPYEAGKDAQDAWADWRASARNNAVVIIAKATGAA